MEDLSQHVGSCMYHQCYTFFRVDLDLYCCLHPELNNKWTSLPAPLTYWFPLAGIFPNNQLPACLNTLALSEKDVCGASTTTAGWWFSLTDGQLLRAMAIFLEWTSKNTKQLWIVIHFQWEAESSQPFCYFPLILIFFMFGLWFYWKKLTSLNLTGVFSVVPRPPQTWSKSVISDDGSART